MELLFTTPAAWRTIKRTWKEVDGQYGETEITVFLDDGSSLVFRQQPDEGTLLLKVPIENNNGGIVRYYEEY